MKTLIKTLVNSIIRRVITKTPVPDIESRTLYYPYRWELFRKWNIKSGYIPVKQYDEQSEYFASHSSASPRVGITQSTYHAR